MLIDINVVARRLMQTGQVVEFRFDTRAQEADMTHHKSILRGWMAAGLVAGTVLAGAPLASAQMNRPDTMRPGQMERGQMRPGQMAPGQMTPMMMQRMMMGMMRGMMGPGRMGMGMMMGRRMTDRKLDAAEVKRILDGRLAWQGNKRLKVGTVTEKDDNTVIAEIQTVDGSLVAKWAVDRTTGRMRYAE